MNVRNLFRFSFLNLGGFILAIGFCLYLSSCKPEKKLVGVKGNTSPVDGTGAPINKENYITRVYISLLGRKPTPTESASALGILSTFSRPQITTLLNDLLNRPEYPLRAYDQARVDYLQNLDTADIRSQINLYESQLPLIQDSFQIDFIRKELVYLYQLDSVIPDLQAGKLTREQMHMRCIRNYFYDQINMGTANFVISSFQNFLFRYPTESELSSAITMVDGGSGVLFLTGGNSKADYLSIFFSSLPYAEGQVRDAFKRYLFRESTTAELSSLSVKLQQDQDYRALQRNLLSSDEYVYP